MLAYSPSLSHYLATHAAAVYHLPHQFHRWALDHGHVGATTIERGSTQIGIAYGPQRIVIACRGSESIGDWGENLMMWRWGWKRILPKRARVHFGFLRQAKRVAPELAETVAALRSRYPDAELLMTGHSLGGALASILAPLMRSEGMGPAAVYTFESPRPGNRAFAFWYDQTFGPKTFRVVCIRKGCADIVTRIPPSCWGWRHAGRPILLRDGMIYESETAWEAARAAHPVKPLAQWRVISRLAVGVGAHAAAALVEDLRSLLSATHGTRTMFR